MFFIRITEIDVRNVAQFIQMCRNGNETKSLESVEKKINAYFLLIDNMVSLIQSRIFFAYADCFDMFLNVLPFRLHMLSTAQIENLNNLLDEVLLNVEKNMDQFQIQIPKMHERLKQQLNISNKVNSLLAEITSGGDNDEKKIETLDGLLEILLSIISGEEIQVNFLKTTVEQLDEMGDYQNILQEKLIEITKMQTESETKMFSQLWKCAVQRSIYAVLVGAHMSKNLTNK